MDDIANAHTDTVHPLTGMQRGQCSIASSVVLAMWIGHRRTKTVPIQHADNSEGDDIGEDFEQMRFVPSEVFHENIAITVVTMIGHRISSSPQ